MRKVSALAGMALAALSLISTGANAAYPERPVRVIVPFGAGGVADITTRIVVEKLGERLGQRFVVENQPGAGGISAARTAASAGPDGHTLTLFTNGTAISVSLFKALPFDPIKDFTPIGTLGAFDGIIATGTDSKLKTFADLLKVAKADPGKLNVGTVSVGSTQNLTAELLKSAANINFITVPFRGTPELTIGVMRDDVNVMVDYYAAMKAGLDDGKLVALATTGAKRTPYLPNVPTAMESGVSGYDVTSWNALYAPAGTPKEIVDLLNKEMRTVLAMPDVQKRMLDLGIIAQSSTPEEQTARMVKDVERWRKVIEQAKIPQQ